MSFFSLSPSVSFKERDRTLTIPAVAATGGAYCGTFQWGPVKTIKTVSTERELVDTFDEPNEETYKDFFTASNFLSYGSNLKLVRVVGEGASSASTSDEHVIEYFDGDGTTVEFDLSTSFTEEPVGVNVFVDGDLQEETTDYTTSYDAGTLTVTFEAASTPDTGTENVSVHANALAIENEENFESYASLPASMYGKYPGSKANNLKIIAVDSTEWDSLSEEDAAIFSKEPTGSELHFAVIDTDGNFSDTENAVIWKKEFLETTVGATYDDGTSAYYVTAVNNGCPYVWVNDLSDVVDGVATLSNGHDVNTVSDADRILGYDLFKNTDEVDFRTLISGEASTEVAIHLISNIAEYRKDCVVFLSPEMEDVVNNIGSEATDVIEFRDTLPSTSYAFLDCNWIYQYDAYNDVHRWVPANSSVAGLYIRTVETDEAWFSIAGYNRGILKNVIKLAWNPNKDERDEIYPQGVNPVISEDGFGSLLFGDKTLLSKPSVFDRINVRMLFILLEKAISNFAKFSLFEFNDEFTRSDFVNRVTPYLRNIENRRGFNTDNGAGFYVKCDEENNDAAVRQANSFVGDIHIKPNMSINYIRLNFIARDQSVSFSEG